jgi:murein DD-endopeptidase MepM/ murein hydrolase activator NlpD
MNKTVLKFICALAAAVIRLSVVPSLQAGVVSDEMVKIFTREQDGLTHFYVQNLQGGNVTATLKLRSSNLHASATFPCTIELAPNQTVEAFNFSPIRADLPWKYTYERSSIIGSVRAVADTNFVYRLPYACGETFPVSQGYHGKFSHTGPDEYAIDWKMPVGTPVHAARGGLVVKSKDDADCGGPERKYECCANCILIQHDDGTIGIYGHLKKGGNQVKVGDRVKAGDLIALSGNTGFSSGPHLHFAVFKAHDGATRESLPVKFQTVGGPAFLVSGKQYQAQPSGQPAYADLSLSTSPTLVSSPR